MNVQFFRFLIVGVGATLLHLIVYWEINAIAGLGENQQLALTASYSVGYFVSLIANYIISLKWTFQTEGNMRKGMGFLLSHMINYGMHIGLLNLSMGLGVGYWLVHLSNCILPATFLEIIPLLSKPSSLAPIPVYLIVIPINFLLVRYFLTRQSITATDKQG